MPAKNSTSRSSPPRKNLAVVFSSSATSPPLGSIRRLNSGSSARLFLEQLDGRLRHFRDKLIARILGFRRIDRVDGEEDRATAWRPQDSNIVGRAVSTSSGLIADFPIGRDACSNHLQAG